MKKGLKKPNVLVAGFPKSGSTFLYHILKQHPDIFIPKIKELNYFNKDHFFLADPEILNPRYFKSRNWYFNFFTTNKKVVIDFSILSALDVASARRAKKLLGDARIIFIIRNKKDFISSMERFMKKQGQIYKGYKEYSEYDYYIKPYTEQFSNVLIVNLENLNKNPDKELDKITKFLGIKKHEFNLNVHKLKTEEYHMGLFQRIKRKTFFWVNNLFYKFIAFTVIAKIKAEGEK